MDIAKLKVRTAAEAGSEMALLSPFDGTETGACLTVLGYDARVVQDAEDAVRKSFMGKKGGTVDGMSDAMRLARICAAVTGWSNFEFNGKAAKFSPDRFRDLMLDPDFSWIGDQVEIHGRQRGNFMPSALKG